MTSTKKNEEFILDAVGREIDKNIDRVYQEIQDNFATIQDDFYGTLCSLFEKAIEKQESGEKGKIVYLHICYLHTSLYTKSYEVQLSLFTQDFFADDVEVSSFWRVPIIFDWYERELDEIQSVIKMNVRDFDYTDFLNVRYATYMSKLQIVRQLMMELVSNVEEKIPWNRLNIDEHFLVNIGCCYLAAEVIKEL